jgi:hypothetical protein
MDGLTLSYELSGGSVHPGTSLTGTAVLTNTTRHALRLTLQNTTANVEGVDVQVHGPGGGGAVKTSDAVVIEKVTLDAGQSWRKSFNVTTRTCGDTRSGPQPPLHTGRYDTSITLYYRDAAVVSDNGPTPSESASPSDGLHPLGNPSPSASPSPDVVRPEGSWSAVTSFEITPT